MSQTDQAYAPDLYGPELAALIVENAREYAIFTLARDGTITSWSPGAASVLGYSAQEALGADVSILFTPSDIAAGADRAELQSALDTGRAEDSRWHLKRNGERFWANGATMRFDWRGEPALLKVMRDETAAKRAAEQRILLLNELNHRIKNTLVTVQSIAEQTLRSGSVDAGTRSSLTGRLLALSEAHNVLVQESWAGAGLRAVVGQALGAYSISLDGVDVRLSPQQAVSISLALHELATNAVKHGALGSPAGKVSLSWNDAHDGEGRRFLTLLWEESGGPPVRPPTKAGFGTRLLSRSFAESHGEVRMDFAEAGLRCVISLPLTQPGEVPTLDVRADPASDGAERPSLA